MWGIVVNNKDYFKRFFFFLSSVYIVNLDMGLTTSIDTKYFDLTIMSDQKKNGFGELASSKYSSLTINLTQGKHVSGNGERPKILLLKLIF
jgi:hypothetical protein